MTSPFAVRDYRTGDAEGVLGLLRAALGAGRAFERSTAFWNWKHFQNPFGESLMMVAENTEVVGLRAFMRWRFKAGTRTLAAVRAVDTATHTSYRRHGVFSTLTRLSVERAQRDGVDLIFNTPNGASLPGYLKLGWKYAGRPAVLARVVKPLRVAKAVLERDSSDTDEVPPAPTATPPESPLNIPDVLDNVLVENDRLLGDRLRTDRSVQFLRWRYGGAPSLTYGLRWLGSSPSQAAVIFRLRPRRRLREAMLSEVLLSRAGMRDFPALIRRVIDELDVDYLVAHAAVGSAHWRALLGAGFLPVPRVGPHFTVRPLSSAGIAASPMHLRHWQLSLGDLEVF